MRTRPDTEPASRLLDVHEAAALLAVKPSTLYQWKYRGEIPFVKVNGHALRFRLSDLERIITDGTRPALRPTGQSRLDKP